MPGGVNAPKGSHLGPTILKHKSNIFIGKVRSDITRCNDEFLGEPCLNLACRRVCMQRESFRDDDPEQLVV